MENRVILRELKWSDLNALENVIRKTWDYDKFATPETAGKLAKAYLSSCLANQTYTRVAEVNGVTAGVILGKNTEKHSLPVEVPLAAKLQPYARHFDLKEGREILNFYRDVDGIDDQLLKRCGKDYQGEVSLFALSPEYRGLGIGKKLFDCLLAYMKSQSIEDFYLYTDTSCNFGFYEHQGMKRQQQHKQLVNLRGQNGNLEFYLYDMSI